MGKTICPFPSNLRSDRRSSAHPPLRNHRRGEIFILEDESDAFVHTRGVFILEFVSRHVVVRYHIACLLLVRCPRCSARNISHHFIHDHYRWKRLRFRRAQENPRGESYYSRKCPNCRYLFALLQGTYGDLGKYVLVRQRTSMARGKTQSLRLG